MKRAILVTTHLEITNPVELRPKRGDGSLDVRQACVPSPELGRFLYTAVGGPWYWTDRLGWSYAQWKERLELTETWVGYFEGTPVGYFELERQGDSVEIAYFGLLPAFIGRGLGGALLTCAIERGWHIGAKRVWVHTCTLDGPAALANYLARGMTIFKEEREEIEISDDPPGPWPGAHRG